MLPLSSQSNHLTLQWVEDPAFPSVCPPATGLPGTRNGSEYMPAEADSVPIVARLIVSLGSQETTGDLHQHHPTRVGMQVGVSRASRHMSALLLQKTLALMLLPCR